MSAIVVVFRLLVKVATFLGIGFLILAYAPGLLDVNPQSVEFPPFRNFTGSLAPNHHLEKLNKLFLNQIKGPESIAIYRGEVYTGLHNGYIVRVVNDKVLQNIVTLGDPACEEWEEDRCGRPLGLRFDDAGNLYVTDAYKGLARVDVKTGSATFLYPSSVPVNQRPSRVVNDFDRIPATGEIYFTDSSSKWPLMTGLLEFLESAPNGRLLKWDPKTNQTSLVLDKLHFPNGVQLTKNGDALLVVETSRKRVLKYYLAGSKKGQKEVFIDNLPGAPDNIRPSLSGGYWLALCVGETPTKANIQTVLAPQPLLRKVLCRLLYGIHSFLKLLDELYPTPYLKLAAYKVTHTLTYASVDVPYSLVLELNDAGEIVRSLHGSDGTAGFISEAHEVKPGVLYLGSPWNPFLGKLQL